MTMLLYHLHTLVERRCAWRDQRKAVRKMDALLRGHGFVETAPGDWRKTIVLAAPVCSGDRPLSDRAYGNCGEPDGESGSPPFPRQQNRRGMRERE
jgi:hypothetical protein